MSGIIFAFFVLSAVLFCGTFYNIMALQKPGFYPPKKILKKRAGALAGGGALFLIIGMIFSSFQ
ncbi:hypothetical protein ACFYKX_06400 [Cytobacillus sp. FJAT-54145]|uniref:Uncharacterized protein n=1 Tax=Cytobacillus spartinae TaxID=3299023 RepID=A0ABW6KBD6_9BACI